MLRNGDLVARAPAGRLAGAALLVDPVGAVRVPDAPAVAPLARLDFEAVRMILV